MKLLVISVFCAALLRTSTAVALGKVPNRGNSAGRIIGGSEAVAAQFPFAAAIYAYTDDGTYFCTGAFAGYHWIITSASCVQNGVLFVIRLGSTALNDADAIIVSASDYLIHPEYDPDTFTADIGLIRLYEELDISHDSVWPIVTYPTFIQPDADVSIVGWGHTADDVSDLSDTLRYANVTALSTEGCRVYYGNRINDNMICVQGDNNEGTCVGDTGGPLFFFEFPIFWIVGIASFISANGCDSVEPSGYTRIGPYMTWIDTNVYAG